MRLKTRLTIIKSLHDMLLNNAENVLAFVAIICRVLLLLSKEVHSFLNAWLAMGIIKFDQKTIGILTFYEL